MQNTPGKLKRYPLTLLDKINVCLETIGDHAFHFVFILDTRLDLDRFKGAMRLSLIAEPLYACRFVYDKWEPYWEEWDPAFLDGFDFCELEVTDRVEEGIMKFLLIEMDPCTEPFIKAKVFRSDTDTVCVNVNCIVADGAGMGKFLFDIWTIYNRLATDPDYLPIPGNTSHRTTKHLMHALSFMDLVKLPFMGVKNHFTNRKTTENWAFPCQTGSGMKKTFVYRLFDEDLLDALNRFRKTLSATVNDVMLAAYYQALFQIINPTAEKPFCVLNTYDLRKYLPAGIVPGVANYSSYINTNIHLDPSTPFVEIVKRVQTSIQEQKRNYPGLTEAPYIWLIFKCLPFAWSLALFKWLLRKRGGSVPVLTNAGVFDIRRLVVDGVPMKDGFPIGPLLYPPKLTVGLATTGKKLLLCVGFSEAHFNKADVEKLFDFMGETIKKSAAQTDASLNRVQKEATENSL